MTLERLEHGAYVHPDDPGEIGYKNNPPRISVTDDEARLLASLVPGRNVLEIGTGLGISARAMSTTANLVYTVDTDDWVKRCIAPYLPKRVYFIDSLSKIADRNAWDKVWFDVAFIDGWHEKEAVMMDIGHVHHFFNSEYAQIILHDTKLPGVRAAIEEYDLKPIIEFDTHYGLGVYEP
jgi:hypothetical protein